MKIWNPISRKPAVMWLQKRASHTTRLGWIWISSGVIVAILLIVALFHYPHWHTDSIVSLTAAAVGFDDSPGYKADTSTDSIVANALNSRMYSRGAMIDADENTTYAPTDNSDDASEANDAEGTETPASDPSETPVVDPYDTPMS